MRIIAGMAKGRRLVAPPGRETRPLTDRAKEALFSSLAGVVPDARVLDLYAGTGSLGLEALSRGAAGAVFVERDHRAVEALERNIRAVGAGGEVRAGAVEVVLPTLGSEFDLVFVDPPYALAAEAVDAILALVAAAMADGAVAVLHRRFGGEAPAVPEGLQLVDRRRYGDAELWRYLKEDV